MRVRRDLDLLGFSPARRWTRVHDRGESRVLDVLIVGGGQGGLATAFGLQRERIGDMRIVDRAPPGLEGPWRTYARMHTLRTPKAAVGMDFGVPSLTARAWYEARYGRRAWDAISAISRTDWQLYLDWYRDTLGIPVENGVSVERIESAGDDMLNVAITGPNGAECVLTRKIVLATGLQGAGTWYIPDIVQGRLRPEQYAHGSAEIDFARLRDCRVAVIGAGASGFDNAAVALEAGAARVDMFLRRPALPRVNPLTWFESPASLANFADLPDLHRWRMGRSMVERGIPPPDTAIRRCRAHAAFTVHTSAPWHDVIARAHEFDAVTPRGRFTYDFVICATSADPSPAGRPELAALVDDIALWEDRFTPPPGEESPGLGRYPYLGAAYEFTERRPGMAPWLRHIHNFSFGAVGSMGSTGGVPSLKYALPRLIRGIMRDLFVDDADAFLHDFLSFERGALPADLATFPVVEYAHDQPASAELDAPP